MANSENATSNNPVEDIMQEVFEDLLKMYTGEYANGSDKEDNSTGRGAGNTIDI